MPIAHTKHIQGLLNLGSVQPILQDVTSNITGVKCQAGTKRFKDPFIEEFTKGLALLFIYLFFTKEMDNVVDGIVYGALVCGALVCGALVWNPAPPLLRRNIT